MTSPNRNLYKDENVRRLFDYQNQDWTGLDGIFLATPLPSPNNFSDMTSTLQHMDQLEV